MKKHISFVLLLIFICVLTSSFCQNITSTDAEDNFEHFWRAYQTKYPFFVDKQIDWQKQYRTYRPLVNKHTSNDSLFQLLSAMIAPLQDAHVEVHTHGETNEKKFWARKPARFSQQFQFNKDSLLCLFTAVDTTLLEAGFEPIKAIGGLYTDSLRQFYYTKSAHVGYIRMIECSYGKAGSGRKLVEMDSIFSYFGSAKALILDIRFNRGGGEGLALQIAGRFTDKTIQGAYRYRRKKNGGYADFVKLTSFRNKVRPSKGKRYLGPVYLLTNDRTVSAGDLVALYMSQLPSVTIIGQPTEGSFDSFRYEYLPNGWHFSVPQKRYVRASDKLCYEGVGIPAKIKIENTQSELKQKVDHVVLRTLSQIQTR